MKKKVLLTALLVFGLISTSCMKEDHGSNIVNLRADIDEIINTAQSGSWAITSFTDSGSDKTTSFFGYQFSFNPDGSLIVDSRTDNVEGSWSITVDDRNGDIGNESVINNNDDSGNGEVSSSGGDDGNGADPNGDVTAGENGNNGASLDDGTTGDGNGNAEDNDNTEDSGNTVVNDDCNNCVSAELLEVLTGCSGWFIDKLERNDEDLDDTYSNYRFDFSEDGTLIAKNGSTNYSGTWESTQSGNNINVTINVPNLEQMNDTWNLHEIESENEERKVDLRIDGDDRLRFKNRCATSAKIDLKVAVNNLNFNISFANPPNFNALSADWNIVSHSDVKIELIRFSGADNSEIDSLTFDRN